MKLSIIIPVYNVERYLDECLSSICDQTFRNLEIICVNDGSTDGSLEILRTWEKRDSRITILSTENRGVSMARNLGFEIATGEYIACVDPDDVVEPEMYERLLPIVEDQHLDVLGCGYRPTPYDKKVDYHFCTEQTLTTEQLLSSSNVIQSSNDLCFPWRFIIRRGLLEDNNLRMNAKIRIGEDMIFMMQVVSVAQRIYLTNYAPYHYRTTNMNSLMHLTEYKDYLESSYAEMYRQKKMVIEKYKWDKYTPISFDLAKYTVMLYLPYLIRNRFLLRGKYSRSDVKEILAMPMFRDAFQVIGFRNIFTNLREYIFYLAEKFCFMPLVMLPLKKSSK